MFDNRKYLIHPYFIMMALLLAGVSALFVGFSVAYVYSRIQNGTPPVALPILFYFNTAILLITSAVLHWARKQYLSDNTDGYKTALWITMAFSLLFLFMQILAWKQLQEQDIFVNYSNMASYIYLISGVHFMHVVLGIPFLALFIYNAMVKMKTPVSVLVYFSDPAKERKLRLLTIYWHFLDFLWIYLIVFFLINYLIQ